MLIKPLNDEDIVRIQHLYAGFGLEFDSATWPVAWPLELLVHIAELLHGMHNRINVLEGPRDAHASLRPAFTPSRPVSVVEGYRPPARDDDRPVTRIMATPTDDVMRETFHQAADMTLRRWRDMLAKEANRRRESTSENDVESMRHRDRDDYAEGQ